MALFFSAALMAQEAKPTFEKEGEMLKGTYFHANGEIAQTGYFMDGKLHGVWKMFDENGNKIATGTYTNGKKTGKWYFWKGEELSEVDFIDSKIASVTKLKSEDPMVFQK